MRATLAACTGIVLWIVWSRGAPLRAETILVPTDQPTLAAAVGAARDGDTVELEPNAIPYSGDGFCDVVVGNKRLTIRGGGAGPADTVIDLQNSEVTPHSGITFTWTEPNVLYPDDIAVENLTITGSGYAGGVGSGVPRDVLSGARNCLNVSRCRFIRNTGFVRGVDVVSTSLFYRNNGGVVDTQLSWGVAVIQCVFVDNGGPVLTFYGNPDPNYNSGLVTVASCTFANNTTRPGGGAAVISLPDRVEGFLMHCYFVGNASPYSAVLTA